MKNKLNKNSTALLNLFNTLFLGLYNEKLQNILQKPICQILIVVISILLCIGLFASYIAPQIEPSSGIAFSWNKDYGACLHSTEAFEMLKRQPTKDGRQLLVVDYIMYGLFAAIASCAMVVIVKNYNFRSKVSVEDADYDYNSYSTLKPIHRSKVTSSSISPTHIKLIIVILHMY